jgi:hypothetical protein
MFDNIKKFFVTNWKKLAVAAVATVVAYVLLRYVLAGLLSLAVVSTAGAIGVGYLVYTRVALWEIKALAAKLGIKLDL